MLTDADRELIAAAVDGDLTPAGAAAFHRLIAVSPTALALYEAMQADSRRLQALPRVPAPPQLERWVTFQLHPIEVRNSPVANPVVERGRRSPPRLLPFAVAASVLLVVAVGTGGLALRDSNRGDEVVRQLPRPTPAETRTHRDPFVAATPTPDERVSLPPPRPAAEPPLNGASTQDVAVRALVETAPSPRTPQPTGDVIASGLLNDTRPFDKIQLRVPLLASVTDLDRADVRLRLLAELSDGHAFRLDLFTRDPNAAAEVFRAAAKSAGLSVIIEAGAADRMRRKIPTAWAVYTEALAPADIAILLDQLAKVTRADKATPFGTAHLIPAQTGEQREVRELLGVDPLTVRRVGGTPTPKPISAGTADQVASALTNPATSSEKAAILLAYLPPNSRTNPATSREVKAFLDRRTVRSSVPLLIVMRPAG